MRIKTMATALLVAGLTSTAVLAVDGGGGTVNISGSIIQPPCSIAPDSTDINVSLGAVSSGSINGGKMAPPVPFQIKLLDCNAETSVKVTFHGMPDRDDPKLLALQGGHATGAGIAFLDSNSTQIDLGAASQGIPISIGKNTLSLQAALKGSTSNSVAVPGDFTSVANFKLDYN